MSVAYREAPREARRRSARRRAPWRQWLIEAERGITAAFRSDSIFFVHLFAGCLSLAAAAMLGLTATQWAILIVAFAMTLAAELFHQILKQLGSLIAQAGPKPAAALRKLGVAAVAVTTLGSAAAIAVLLGSKVWALFQ